MRIGIATDHNGVDEKKNLIEFLRSKGYEVIDYSTHNTPIDDYPDYAFLVGESLVKGEIDLGILLCGTGIGMSIAANKITGIRCAKVSTPEEAFLARSHNDANIIALSYKTNIEALKEIIQKFIETPFSNEDRHIRRIDKIIERENK